MSQEEKPLSTSALAKKLKKTTRQMFAELEALGWIRHADEQWHLTAKGEFEQGRYRESEKFGRYIIWPSDIADHNALVSPDRDLLNATQIGRELSLSGYLINRILVDLGWIESGRKGWLVTRQGEKQGGVQRENNRTGIPFVLWPEAVIHENTAFCQRISVLKEPVQQQEHYLALDGHQSSTVDQARIDNYLYLAGILHAIDWPLPFDGELCCDFYLPQHRIVIECWGSGLEAADLSKKMRIKELVEREQLALIILESHDFAQLESVLSRQLLKYGVESD